MSSRVLVSFLSSSISSSLFVSANSSGCGWVLAVNHDVTNERALLIALPAT